MTAIFTGAVHVTTIGVSITSFVFDTGAILFYLIVTRYKRRYPVEINFRKTDIGLINELDVST